MNFTLVIQSPVRVTGFRGTGKVFLHSFNYYSGFTILSDTKADAGAGLTLRAGCQPFLFHHRLATCTALWIATLTLVSGSTDGVWLLCSYALQSIWKRYRHASSVLSFFPWNSTSYIIVKCLRFRPHKFYAEFVVYYLAYCMDLHCIFQSYLFQLTSNVPKYLLNWNYSEWMFERVFLIEWMFSSVQIQRSRDKLQELVLSFHHMGPGDQNQVVRLGMFTCWAILLVKIQLNLTKAALMTFQDEDLD